MVIFKNNYCAYKVILTNNLKNQNNWNWNWSEINKK